MPKKYDAVILSPIFYVNAAPHIGHLYTAILCDTTNRYLRQLKRQTTFFSIGTDEHGLKVQKSAVANGMDTFEFCTTNSDKFKTLFSKAGVEHDRYIRTTDDDHKLAVRNMWTILQEKGFIHEGEHKGFYSTNEETFMTEKDLTFDEEKGAYITALGEQVEEITERNYKFEFKREVIEDVQKWLPEAVVPAHTGQLMHQMLSEDRNLLSVSRTKERIKWAIDVPGDES